MESGYPDCGLHKSGMRAQRLTYSDGMHVITCKDLVPYLFITPILEGSQFSKNDLFLLGRINPISMSNRTQMLTNDLFFYLTIN